MITARLVDQETGETLAETALEPADLPPSFARAEATLEIGGAAFRVTSAEPDGREAIARAGEVTLRLARVEAALAHDQPTRDDALPEMDDGEGGRGVRDGLRLPAPAWRQVELVAATLRDALDAELGDVRAAAATGAPGAHARCHVRTRLPAPLDGARLTRAELVRALGGADPRPLALGGRAGVVRGGFAIPLGDSIVYGYVTGEGGERGGVRVVGLAGEPREVAPRLAELARQHHLLLVDWCAATVWEPAEEGFVEA
jgi:hypothetical protein